MKEFGTVETYNAFKEGSAMIKSVFKLYLWKPSKGWVGKSADIEERESNTEAFVMV